MSTGSSRTPSGGAARAARSSNTGSTTCTQGSSMARSPSDPSPTETEPSGPSSDCRSLDNYFGTANPSLWGTHPMPGTETSGSTTVTVSSTAGLVAGDIVYGTGIPLTNLNHNGFVDITAVVNGTTLTIDQPATSSGTVQLSFVTAATLDAVEGFGYPVSCPTWDGSFSDAVRASAPPPTSFYAPECSIPAWMSGPPNPALLWDATGNPDGVKCMTEEDYLNQVGANTQTSKLRTRQQRGAIWSGGAQFGGDNAGTVH